MCSAVLAIMLSAMVGPAPLPAAVLVNIAGPQYGTRISADTQFSPEYCAARVADGSLEQGGGCWFSRDETPLPCAVTFKLAEPSEIRRVAVVQAFWTGSMYHTRQFAIEVSDDGAAWHRVAIGELPDESLARQEVDLDCGPTCWLRVVVLSSYVSFQTCGFAEIELLAAGVPVLGPPNFALNGRSATGRSATFCGLALLYPADGPQVVVTEQPATILAALREGECVHVEVEVADIPAPVSVGADFALMAGECASVALGAAGEKGTGCELRSGGRIKLEAPLPPESRRVWFELRGLRSEAAVRLSGACLSTPARSIAVPLMPLMPDQHPMPPPVMPPLRPPMERALIEWDWRMQDGLGTPRAPVTYAEAIERLLQRGAQLLADLHASRVDVAPESARWQGLRERLAALRQKPQAPDEEWEALWREAHWLRRAVAFKNPLAATGPLVFAKQVPGAFSHQLTQYYGRYARPGGGIFVLEEPGHSMRCRSLTESKLASGSYQHPEVSFEGDRILFSYCEAPTSPSNNLTGHPGRYFHLYEVRPDGSELRQLTDGPFDDFAPRYLPDGRIVFISTRRGGWHRCGNPGCENYTLTLAESDGSNPRPISYHETQEWDPAVLHDGRIIYTRWDYVDRNAVFFEQLWATRPDGSGAAVFFGNNTFNPVGIWEARAVPGSQRVMATAAAHHAMTAGAIILVDVAAGVDGKEPIIRLTPETPFPEGEAPVAPGWYSAAPEPRQTEEYERWPGHCYRSPYPLSEKYFLAAFSFEGLVGEPKANAPNLFGLYLVDVFGNRELLYRDLEVSSAWPTPLRPRQRPPVLSKPGQGASGEGTFIIQDVYTADPPLERGTVQRLRVLQVLPKSTPGIDNPPVGLPRGAPGKQVLGTVPVEPDGSAHFRAPAGVPLAFQALDQRGRAIQIMRSATYLQPGEVATCVGCHEPRTSAPPLRRPQAARRPPSTLTPGPDGSKPFSYPLLVQPVLDRHCVRCHSGQKPEAGIRLTGEPEGHYTVSYNALAPRVPFSDQGSLEALSRPNQYGARGSRLMKMLLEGHHDVQLSADDLERLITWMDTNVLFYGTFDPADQARQRVGERIAGPALE